VNSYLSYRGVLPAVETATPSYSSPAITNLIPSTNLIVAVLPAFVGSLTTTLAVPLRASVTVISHSATFTLVELAAAFTVPNLVPESLTLPHLNV
jgi:hypothetical protein